MADQMKPTPRGFISGLFSDIVNLPLQYMSAPQRTQQMQGAAEFLYGTGIPKTLERMSYGDSLFSGSGMTLRPKEETINAAMNVAPFAPAVGRVAGRAVRATEGIPVGMSIKDVGKGIASNTSQFTGFKNTTPYGKAKEVAAYLDKLNVPYTINKSKTTNSAYLEIQTGKGDFDYPMQFRFSDHSTDLPHQNRQIFTNPKPDPNFDLDMFKDGGHDTDFAISKINDLVAKVKPKTVSQPSPYPQQAALDLAQQRAALPVEQGGLGLPANNTPEMRAQAMGFDVPAYHGTTVWETADGRKLGDIQSFNRLASTEIVGRKPSLDQVGIWASDRPDELGAGMYSGSQGAIYPLMLRMENPKATSYEQMARTASNVSGGEVLGAGVLPRVSNVEPYRQLLRDQGYDSLRLSAKQGSPYTEFQDQTGYVLLDPDQLRSRFAAFDPFRKDVATATAMGVALPDLLAQPVNQYQPTYETIPMYTDPFGNTIGSSIR